MSDAEYTTIEEHSALSYQKPTLAFQANMPVMTKPSYDMIVRAQGEAVAEALRLRFDRLPVWSRWLLRATGNDW